MSMVFLRLTHCSECHKPLKSYEFGICEECENKEKQRIEKQRQKEQKEKEKILNIFYNMNEYEQKALEEFIHKIGKEYKRKETEKEIERLKKELEE